MTRITTLASALLLFAFTAAAHSGLDEQIADLTRRIGAEPSNAALYLQRGELHRLHGEFDAARADFDRVAELDPSLDVIDFARGKLDLDAGRPAAAKASLDRFLERHPRHAEARLTRARALVRLEERAAAVADYDAAIANDASPSPDMYHERANALADLGRVDDALRGLDEGIARLGNITALQRQAMAIERAASRHDAALARLEAIASRSPRKEAFLAEKAEILASAGRTGEARAAWREALARIEALPQNQRNSIAVRELTARVKTALASDRNQ